MHNRLIKWSWELRLTINQRKGEKEFRLRIHGIRKTSFPVRHQASWCTYTPRTAHNSLEKRETNKSCLKINQPSVETTKSGIFSFVADRILKRRRKNKKTRIWIWMKFMSTFSQTFSGILSLYRFRTHELRQETFRTAIVPSVSLSII